MHPAAEQLPAGLVTLRRWRADDVDAVHRAVTESLDHLAPWMVWATHGYPRTAAVEFIERTQAAWESGEEFGYAVTVRPRGVVVGSCSLIGRIGPGGWEIGYWVHPHYTGRGYATAAVVALVREAFRIGADRVEIVHDIANVASGAIPRRLGFTEVERRAPQGERTAAEEGEGVDVVWRLLAAHDPSRSSPALRT